MMPVYDLLKLAHIAAVIVWLGGSLFLAFLTAAFLRAGDRTVIIAFLKEAGFYGPVIVGPSSLLVLLTGLGMALMTHGFSSLWVQLGFGGIGVHFILGAGLVRAASVRVQHLVAEPAPDPAKLASAGKRLTVLNAVYLLTMLGVVAVMVLKPA